MGTIGACIYLGAVLVVIGVAGYFIEKRRRGPQAVRRFLIWYAFAWPFMAAGFVGLAYPKLHWLYFVEIAIAAVGYAVQYLDIRRQRAKKQAAHGPTHVDLRRRL